MMENEMIRKHCIIQNKCFFKKTQCCTALRYQLHLPGFMDALKMKVSVVILNWNGKKFLSDFLPKVIQYSHGLADIVVAVGDLPFLVVDLEQIVVAAYHCSLMEEEEKADPFQVVEAPSLAEENATYLFLDG